MRFSSDIHKRRNIRLAHHDYSGLGPYFITLCTHNRECLFGHVADGKMHLNDAGRLVESVWYGMPTRFPYLKQDEFVVMPDHIHAIIALCRGEPCVRPATGGQRISGEFCVRPATVDQGTSDEFCVRPATVDQGASDEFCVRPATVDQGASDEFCVRPATVDQGASDEFCVRPYGTAPDSLGRMIQALKSIVTHEYIRGVAKSGWPPFSGKVWQRNYWERIIRNETELQAVRQYIRDNPAKWQSGA